MGLETGKDDTIPSPRPLALIPAQWPVALHIFLLPKFMEQRPPSGTDSASASQETSRIL